MISLPSMFHDIGCKDSYDSNLDESTFLVTPRSGSNKDECLTPRDDIEFLLHHDPSTPLKSVASILEGFINDPLFEENDDLFDLECKTNDWKRILYDAPIDEAECFDPGGDNDKIEAFLAIEVPTYIEDYYDSKGDILYLESLLSDDTTHNFSSDVFFDHEPQQIRNEPENESLITFSPKSDPLHHEFTGELITIPPGIVREHEDYINRMSLLCGNSSSRSPKNSHTIIESLPTSTTLVEDSDSNREEIDIFSRPDDSIPPGIESDFDSEEDIIDNLLNDDPIPEYEHLTFNMEPDVPMINNVDELNEDECFDPWGGEINVEVKNYFKFITWTFLPYLIYPECIDYTLWEIVENGNAPIVTKTVDGKETVIPPTSVEEKAQRMAELKARSTLLMADMIQSNIVQGRRTEDTEDTGLKVKLKERYELPRIEAIRLFLAYASYKDFVVYQMDVKSAFLYGKIEEEIMDKCKRGLGYNVVPRPYTGNFMPPKSNLVYPSLDDFVNVNESVVEKPTVETNKPETSRKENGALIIEDWVSDSDEENVPKVKTVEMFNKPSFAKINFVKSTKQVKSPRKTSVDKNRQNTPSP
ncbi:ribonuclease H-like domain-containing protein [Tanacetum coccineum]|uniref:Ribonuclease H-like domain-containing protein n=1 Tax=Tanacetum coccineum TaxID=301880 RepID=A0ABQ4YJ25_9ASTR